MTHAHDFIKQKGCFTIKHDVTIMGSYIEFIVVERGDDTIIVSSSKRAGADGVDFTFDCGGKKSDIIKEGDAVQLMP